MRNVLHALALSIIAASVIADIGCATTPSRKLGTKLSSIEQLLDERRTTLDSCLRQNDAAVCERERRRYETVLLAIRIASSQGENALVTPPYPPEFADKEQAFLDCLEKFPPPQDKPLEEWGPCKAETMSWQDYSDARGDVWKAILMDKSTRSSTTSGRRVIIYQPTGRNRNETVYDADECVGPVIMGRCRGSILPKKARHPICHGVWLNGRCTGPVF